MGFRSYFFVRRLAVRNYGSNLIRNRLAVTRIEFVRPSPVTQICFSSAVSAVVNSNSFVACSGLF
jgi:hypothetical protein